jgi:hypothetical protein
VSNFFFETACKVAIIACRIAVVFVINVAALLNPVGGTLQTLLCHSVGNPITESCAVSSAGHSPPQLPVDLTRRHHPL